MARDAVIPRVALLRRVERVALVFLACAALAATCLAHPARRALAEGLPEPKLAEAEAAALMDKGGNILYQRNGTKHMHPASVTKVMTAMVALDSGCDLGDTITLAAPDLGDDSQMGDYAEGDKATLGELLRVLLVYSANDAAYNIAEHVAGSQEAFVDLMNRKAAEIGMDNTHFLNTHGLGEDGHYTCAIDLCTMGRYALEHYPFIAQAGLMHSVGTTVQGERIVLYSTNRLLDTYPGIRGLKTGALIGNYTFVGGAGRGNTQLYVAVLGCKTLSARFDDAAALMDWGYAQYRERAVARRDWALRLQPHAYDLAAKVVVSPTSDAAVQLWPEGGALAYRSVLARPSSLLDAGDACGWTTWQQAGSELCGVAYATREQPVRVSSWPVFSLPLFTNTATLGRSDLVG